MKKDNSIYKFRDIIKKDQFDRLNQEKKKQFLIDKNILIKVDHTEFKLNHEICSEIFESYIIDNKKGWDEISYLYSQRLDATLDQVLEIKKKRKILKKEYKLHLKEIKKNFLLPIFFTPNRMNDITFQEYISEEISRHLIINDAIGKAIINTEHIIIKYIIREPVKWYSFSIALFINWYPLEANSRILNLLKPKLSKNSEPEKASYKNEAKRPFDNEIFTCENAQKWFFKMLRDQRAIDTENKAIPRIFQPVCNQIYETNYEYSEQKNFFRNNISKKDYIIFLNNTFGTKINPNNSKLSISNKYTDTIEKWLKKYNEAQQD